MHPNENLVLVLVIPLLNADNYHSWPRSMTKALRSKNKLHFIHGALPRPPDEDRDSIAWARCNKVIMSWLNNSIEYEISQSVLWMERAPGIWKELKDHFYHGDVFIISEIREEICTLRKDIDKIHNYRDYDQVIRFLKGLNDNYSTVRSQIMLMDPLPNICKVYSLLVQQERQFIVPIDESKLLAFPATQSQCRGNSSFRGKGSRSGRSFYGRGKGMRVCTHCGITDHTIDTCFKKHGYPPHWQLHGQVNNVSTDYDQEDEA
ncbi:uncharacterized protein LOC127104508 [Lathyrus oleraceus]|uniref:uncharacterized protein LOC127104508 n=1 Tax=Pisum sativum TaxID=3888 RepID=UPI0021D07DE5|nr:uncharacterized protein LOC127104508 [Pisum sativum]